MSQVKKAKLQKTISSGSDGSAGFLVPEDSGGSSDPNAEPRRYRAKEFSKQTAGDLIESALRGTVDAILESLSEKEIVIEETVEEIVAAPVAPKIKPVPDIEVEPKVSIARAPIAQTVIEPENPAPIETMPNRPSETIPAIPALQVVDAPIQEAIFDDVDLNDVFAENMENGEEAYRINQKSVEPVKVPLSVPNYHRPDQATTRICSTCKFYKPLDNETGDCTAYTFVANHQYTCDSWTPVAVPTNGVDSDRVPELDEDGNVVGEGLKAEAEAEIPDTADRPEVPSKYEHIDFTVSKKMAENARRALEVRSTKPESERGMTPVGISRATQLANRQAVSPDTWERMLNYFTRHEGDKQGSTWSSQGKGWQAWMGWGGDEAYDKAKRVVDDMRKADAEAAAKCYGLPSGLVQNWYQSPVPPDISDRAIYESLRAQLRNEIAKLAEDWSIYHSLRLRKNYQIALNNYLHEFEGLSPRQLVIPSDIISILETEVLNQGGDVRRKRYGQEIAGYDDRLGIYTPSNVRNWINDKWVDIASDIVDTDYPECQFYTLDKEFPLPAGCVYALNNLVKQNLLDRYKGIKQILSPAIAQKIVDCDSLSDEEKLKYPECGETVNPVYEDKHVDKTPSTLRGGAGLPDIVPDDDSDHENDNSDESDESGEGVNGSEASGDAAAGANAGAGATSGGTATASDDVVSFAKKSAMPMLLISTIPEIQDDELNQYKQKFEEHWQGTESSLRNVFLDRTKSVGNMIKDYGESSEFEMIDENYEITSPLGKIRVVSGPLYQQQVGERVNSNFEIESPSEDETGLGEIPHQYAYERKPELSYPHGRERNIIPIFLPNDRVYSKSMRSLGEVVKSDVIHNQPIYVIKLINASGVVYGHATTHESDLTPRSMRAIKRIAAKGLRETVKFQIQDVIDSIEELLALHENTFESPITTSEINDLEEKIKTMLSNPNFDDASSKMEMRKYIRAMQDMEHTTGAAGHILHGAYDMIANLDDNAAAEIIMGQAQKNVVNRLKMCVTRAEESLMDETPMRTYMPKSYNG